MNTMIKATVLLLGLLVSLNVSAVETPDTGENGTPAPCVDSGQGILVYAGDTLSGITRRIVSQEFQSRKELEKYLYECNQDAFRDSPDELIAGTEPYFPMPKRQISLAQPPPEDNTSTEENVVQHTASHPLLLSVILGMTFILSLLIVALIISMRQWIKTNNTAPVTPSTSVSSGVAHQNALTHPMEELHALVAEILKQIRQDSTKNAENLDKLQSISVTLRHALDEKDEEIRRFKKGYDAQVFRKFLLRFIRTDLAINDFAQDAKNHSKSFGVIKKLLEDALDACGVETFSPQIGEDYRQADGVADNPKTTVSNDANKRYRIAEIIEQGYRMKTLDGYEIVYPAKIRIFITE